MGINNNNEQSAKLTYATNKATTPYITSKPQLQNNKYEYKINLSTPEPATIYYTLNGSKPTTKSTKYTNTITLNNNTLLQYLAITNRNQKQSSTYYYRTEDPNPYVIINNKTEVRNNRQEITLQANKPGKIYYTLNGSTPTKNDIQYTSGQKITLTLKTTIKTILISNNKISRLNTYQPPQNITPPTTIIKAITGLENNTQKIQFITNRNNTTIYYTTNGKNPLTSNTTKTCKPNTQITIQKTTLLQYYTKDQEGYKSGIIKYKTPQHLNERPTITIYNTTPIYSNGQQQIMIQSNQPGKFNITKIDEKITT